MSITLNEGQQKACESIKSFIKSDDKIFLLTGSAGTGKTSVIVHCLTEMGNCEIVFAATTNQAVSVIEKMLNKRLRTECITIHKLLKVKRKIDKEGKEMFQPTIDDENPLKLIKSRSIYSYDIIVIDEVSMMTKELCEKVIALSDKIPGKIIFIGDRAQLPPVNENSSYIFTIDIPHFELTQVMRNGGNILNLSNQTRNLIIANKKISFKQVEGENVKLFRNKHELINNYIELAKDKKNIKLPIILTYTNKNCGEINKKIRNALFDNPTHRYVTGDIIVFNKFYVLKSNIESYYTSQQVNISSVEISSHKIENINFSIQFNDTKLTDLLTELKNYSDNKSYKTWLLRTCNNDRIITIHDDDLKTYNKDIEIIKDYLINIKTYIDKKTNKNLAIIIEKLWNYYYHQFIDQFADIVYGYSITTHKSQGSTYPTVYIDMQDIIMNNPDKDNSYKCLYTAITRSSESINLFY